MDIIIVLMVFLAGALMATLLVWYPLHRRYRETETYEQLCDDVEQIRSQLVSYYDVEQRSRQLMRLITSHHRMYAKKVGYNTKDTRELIPWILLCGESCWEMRELINYLNHIGLDIQLRSKFDNSIMNYYSEEDIERYKNRYNISRRR